MSVTQARVFNGKKATLESLELDFNTGHSGTIQDALCFASENQVKTLVSQGRIHLDFLSFYIEQQEMREVYSNL